MMLHEKRRFLRLKNMNSCLCQTMTNWSSFNIKSLAFDHILNQHQYPSLSPQLKMFISSIIRWPQTAVAIGKKFFMLSMIWYDRLTNFYGPYSEKYLIHSLETFIKFCKHIVMAYMDAYYYIQDKLAYLLILDFHIMSSMVIKCPSDKSCSTFFQNAKQ